jgi:hypothetical protein
MVGLYKIEKIANMGYFFVDNLENRLYAVNLDKSYKKMI